MGSCREILTLQLGTYANYVGAHLWSLQEMGFSYNHGESSGICHDVLFREGLSFRNETTFTPRAICVEGESHIAPIPILQEHVPDFTGDNGMERFDNGAKELHKFIRDLDAGVDPTKVDYEFETTTRSWGDFIRTRLHPRSVLLNYTTFEDEMEDRIRLYIEECDNLQGFHVIVDATQNYAGVQSFLEDEYSSKYRLAFPVLPPSSAEMNRTDVDSRSVQIFRAFSDCSTFSSLTVPLSCLADISVRSRKFREFSNLNYNAGNLYQTSAVLASVIDTVSMSYRLASNPTHMSNALAGLTARGWKFGCASLSLPFGIPPSLNLQQFLQDRNEDSPLWSIATPSASSQDSWYHMSCLRGYSDSDGQVLLQYLQYLTSTVTALHGNTSPMPTLPPFPKIFGPHVSTKGSIDVTATRASGFHVKSVPVLAGLHVGPGVGEMLSELTEQSSKIDLRRLPNIDIESDLYEDYLNKMKALVKDHSCLLDVD